MQPRSPLMKTRTTVSSCSPFPHSSLPLDLMFENIHGWSPTVPSHLVLHRPSLTGAFWSLWQSLPAAAPILLSLWEGDNVDFS